MGERFYSRMICGVLLTMIVTALPSVALAYSMDIANPYRDKMFVAVIDFEDQAGA